MSLEISSSTSFSASPFGKRFREPEETLADGRVLKLPKFCTIPEYIRLVYKTSQIEPIKGTFNFLDRDNKERRYDPGDTDPMVFRDRGSIGEFHKSILKLISYLTQKWENLGLPVSYDKDRNVRLPDTKAVADSLLHPTEDNAHIRELYHKYRSDITMIGSNIDVLKKASLVRTVTPGWYVVSYKGKNTKHVDRFNPALNVILKAFKHIRNTPRFKTVLNDILNEQGDPLDTNVGYPFYTGEVDADGNPISKMKVLKMFANMGTKGYDFHSVIEEIQHRVDNPVLARYPFAVACIRRLQPGYKWAHIWKPTKYGLMLDHDERGNTTNRVAFMASYLLNLYLSPIQSEWKAIRKLIPGCYFDGDSKKRILAMIRKNKSILMESDYSNYDRNIPNNLISRLFAGWAGFTDHPMYYYALLKQTHADLALIWPDWVPSKTGEGWIFRVDELALLSGLKITSEVGTFCNLIIISEALLESKVLDEETLFQYLISGSEGKVIEPLFLIQSDDTMFLHSDERILIRMVNAFVDLAEVAGIPGSLEIGDRFLMRHMTAGVDRPITSRIYQNTLSNEEPYDDPLKFIVGLAARTDGMFGQKTVDPFGTGTNQGISELEREFNLLVLDELIKFLSSAKSVNSEAVRFLEVLRQAGNRMVKRGESYYMRSDDSQIIDNLRKKFIRALAERELSTADKKKNWLASGFISSLHKQALSPSAKYILDEITGMSSEAEDLNRRLTRKENEFYKFAMRTIGLELHVQ